MKEKRANETSQDREARLQKAREYKARMKRMNDEYLANDRNQKRAQRANESPAESEARLQKRGSIMLLEEQVRVTNHRIRSKK